MVQLFGGGFVVHFLAAGPGWRAPEHQTATALTEATCADLFHRLYEAAVTGCAPRSVSELLCGSYFAVAVETPTSSGSTFGGA